MGGRSSYSNALGDSTLSPYSPTRSEWNYTEVLAFSQGVVNISSGETSFTSDITDKLFAMNQMVLYTKGDVKEIGNIMAISTEGKGTQPLYNINLKGGQELEVESNYLSYPLHDQMKEAARRESDANTLASTATKAIKLAEERIAAANDARRAAEEAAQHQ